MWLRPSALGPANAEKPLLADAFRQLQHLEGPLATLASRRCPLLRDLPAPPGTRRSRTPPLAQVSAQTGREAMGPDDRLRFSRSHRTHLRRTAGSYRTTLRAFRGRG